MQYRNTNKNQYCCYKQLKQMIKYFFLPKLSSLQTPQKHKRRIKQNSRSWLCHHRTTQTRVESRKKKLNEYPPLTEKPKDFENNLLMAVMDGNFQVFDLHSLKKVLMSMQKIGKKKHHYMMHVLGFILKLQNTSLSMVQMTMKKTIGIKHHYMMHVLMVTLKSENSSLNM